jgi:Fungal specific transcription factor domain
MSQQNSLSPTRSHEYSQRGLGISPLSQAPPAVLKAPFQNEYINARAQIDNHGRGLIRRREGEHRSARASKHELPELPAQQVAEQAIILYRDCFHRQFPVLHWPTVQQTFESLYARRETSQEAVSIFFCVLAYGTLCSHRASRLREGMEYIRKANPPDNFFQEVKSLDAVVVSLLTGVFFVETAEISTAWVWLGSAIRIAQTLGIHLRHAQSESSEQESRIWFALYCWDR